MRFLRYLPVALLAVLLLVAAGCGGGSKKVPADAVAVVGDDTITKTEFNFLIAGAKAQAKAAKADFPKPGTADYKTLQDKAMAYLVQESELEQKGKDMGIEITDADVSKQITQIKQQFFKGSEKAYKEQLKKQHLTDAQVREDVRAQLVSEAVFNKVSADVKISDKQVHDYYVAHKSSLYQQPQTRDVRYILVGPKKSVAESVFEQLKAGDDQTWCKLAKKYAKDSSGQNCGKATFSKGQTVPIFDKKAFGSPAKKVVPPFYDPTQYKAWFVIEPLGPVKPAKTTPEKQVASQIRSTLLGNKQKQAVSDFSSNLTKSYCSGSKIKYQVGYTPTQDDCTATTNATTTQ